MPHSLRVPVAIWVVLLCAWCAIPARAQTPVVCPDPPNKVAVRVKGTATFDPATRLFTYEFEVFNDQTSVQEVDSFAMDFTPPISDITAPRGWAKSFFDDRTTIHWYASEAVPSPPGKPDTGQVPPGLFQIKPGTSLGGFSFKSPLPPAPMTFYVLGFALLPSAPTEEEAESLPAVCPDISGTFFDLAVTGRVDFIVPFAAFAAKVEVRLSPVPNNDTFEVKAPFTLGADSNGINPPGEDVKLRVGSFSTTIPAGSFRRDAKGRFRFDGAVAGVTLEARIRPLGGQDFEFTAQGTGANLAGTVNPVTVELTIGDDGGSTAVRAEFR